MTARTSQPNAQAEVQDVSQPLLGSAQQTAPSTSSTTQAGANLEATGNGENSSQDNSTVTNKSNSTENLEVFILSVFHRMVGVWWLFLLDVIFLVYVFSSTKGIALGACAR